MSPPNRSRRPVTELFRTFICIEIPPSIKARIGDLQSALRLRDGAISWVRPANIHLTIKFLGDVAASRMPGLQAAAERACASVPAFDLRVNGSGCFPSANNPRVLWIGLDPIPDELRRLQSNVEIELERAGFAREAKPFSPHLTIGRVRDATKSKTAVEQLLVTGFEAAEFRVSQVIVMRSELHPSGSIYSPLAQISLRTL